MQRINLCYCLSLNAKSGWALILRALEIRSSFVFDALKLTSHASARASILSRSAWSYFWNSLGSSSFAIDVFVVVLSAKWWGFFTRLFLSHLWTPRKEIAQECILGVLLVFSLDYYAWFREILLNKFQAIFQMIGDFHLRWVIDCTDNKRLVC